MIPMSTSAFKNSGEVLNNQQKTIDNTPTEQILLANTQINQQSEPFLPDYQEDEKPFYTEMKAFEGDKDLLNRNNMPVS
jgi:hypothetical protein